MKYILALLSLLFLFACGSAAQLPQSDPSSEGGENSPTADSFKPPLQPYVFEEAGGSLPTLPIKIISLPDGKWLIANKFGQISITDEEFNQIAHDDIVVENYSDSGLLNVVLDPDFTDNQTIYLYATISNDTDCADAFCNALIKARIDLNSEAFLTDITYLITIPMVSRVGWHNGGVMGFDSPTSLLLGVGDGEDSDNIQFAYPQDDFSLLGKILRIDLNQDPINPEIVAKGLRNPFTGWYSGDFGLFAGDVGDSAYEEINLIPVGLDHVLNFGWPIEEGPSLNSIYDQPFGSVHHCDEKSQDEDPFGHESVGLEQKNLTVKFHNGVVHECGNTAIAIPFFSAEAGNDPYNGQLESTLIYTELYYGYIRGLTVEANGEASNDRHLAHLPGLVSCDRGPDGYIYCVSLFNSDKILKLVPNEEFIGGE